MEDNYIKQHKLFGLSEFAFKYKNTQHFKRFLSYLLPWIKEVEPQAGTQYINDLIYYILSTYPNGSKEKYIEAVNQYLPNEYGRDKMTIAEQLRQEGWEQGMQQGIERGIKKNKFEVAENFLKENVDERLIAKATGLTLEQINQLKQDLVKVE